LMEELEKAKKNRILIADDAELNRDMLTMMLGSQYDFVYAVNGKEAVECLEKEEIDLVLLDINMPVMDGFDVLTVMNNRGWIEDIPVIIISAEDSNEFITRGYQLGVTDYIRRPFISIVVQKRVDNTLLMHSNQKRLIRLVEKQIYDREKFSNAMINIFSNVIELRNHESGSHTLNVQIITSLLLRRLVQLTDRYHLSKADISRISSLSALHDIGKIKIPENILNKPGKLDADEWELMMSHSAEGDAILAHADLDQESEFVKTARAICRWHHEKYDGGGYPDGLAGDDIPIAAQVVSLADAYDALTSERCYKSAFSHERAMEMILGGECGAFNPLLLNCLEDISEALKNLDKNNTKYDYQSDIGGILDEILESNDLPHAR
jgi:response regulator RpfG family c-di-GMP phosphodiesterase